MMIARFDTSWSLVTESRHGPQELPGVAPWPTGDCLLSCHLLKQEGMCDNNSESRVAKAAWAGTIGTACQLVHESLPWACSASEDRAMHADDQRMQKAQCQADLSGETLSWICALMGS